MEVDDAFLVGTHDIGRKQHAAGQVLRDLAGHVVALDGDDGRVLVRVLLLDFLVVALDEGQDLVVCRVLLALQRLDIAVDDVLAGYLVAVQCHDLILDHVLDILDRDRVSCCLAAVAHILGGVDNLAVGQTLVFGCLAVRAPDRVLDLRDIEGNFRSVALDNLHFRSP